MTAAIPPAIAATAAELLATIDADPRAPHASAQRKVGAMTVTLSRSVQHVMLTLHADAPIDAAAADQWAQAVGAPHRDWWVTRQGCRWTLEWWRGE